MAVKFDRIKHGDCITELDKLEADSVDLAFADPPFNIGYEYDEYDDKRSCADYLDWSKRWMSAVIRVLRPCGAFWLAIGDEYAAELKVIATRELGLTCRSWVVWYYTFGVHCNSKFTRSHAHLFYFVKPLGTRASAREGGRRSRREPLPIANCQLPNEQGSNKRKRGSTSSFDNRQSTIDSTNNGDASKDIVTFNDYSVRVPSARQLVYADKRANPKGRVPDDTWIIPPTGDCRFAIDDCRLTADEGSANAAASVKSTIDNRQSTIGNGWILRPQDLPNGFSANSDTWYFPRVCGTFKERLGFHGCQMPEQLLGRIIKACSNKGDLVLDPFAGSGTTLAVAKKLGRKYLGFEISKEYAVQITKRLSKINPGDPLTGAENPLSTAPNTADGRALLGKGGAGLRKRGRRRKQETNAIQTVLF